MDVPINARSLECPERDQRRALRWGDTPQTGDVHPFVGPVAPQRTQMLAAFQVPERDGPVVSAAGKREAIGACPQRLHRALVRQAHLHAFPALNIPPAQHSITVTTDERRAGWIPGHCIHDSRMPLQPDKLRAIGGLPEDDAAIVAATGQPPPIRAPRHATDGGWLPMTNPPASACAHFPYLHLLLVTSGRQKRSIWTPLYAEEGCFRASGVHQSLHTVT